MPATTVSPSLLSAKRMGPSLLHPHVLSVTTVCFEPSAPVIGMDGKTVDGAVPYQILINQLDFLK